MTRSLTEGGPTGASNNETAYSAETEVLEQISTAVTEYMPSEVTLID